MSSLSLPNDASEEEIEAFLAGLREEARAGVRRLMLAGAGEAEIADYLAELGREPGQEPDEELEPRREDQAEETP